MLNTFNDLFCYFVHLNLLIVEMITYSTNVLKIGNACDTCTFFVQCFEGFYSVLCQICDSIIYQYTKKINQHTVSFYHVSIYWYIEQCGVTPTETLVSTIIIWINNCLMFGCNFKFFIFKKKILLLLMYIYIH